MWVVFLLAAMGFAVATLLVIYIGNKVVNAMRRDDDKLDKDINKDKTNEKEKVKVQKETERIQAEADAQIEVTKAKAEAEANRLKSESITDELIRMKEAEARLQHGWVTTQGANAVVKDGE